MAMAQGQKIVWFRDNMDLDEQGEAIEDEKLLKSAWSKAELGRLVDVYLRRNDEEIEEIKAKRRPGRPLNAKDELVLQVNEVEVKEAKLAGIDVPDLTNGLVVKTLRKWDGDLNSITTIKLAKCKPASEYEKAELEAKAAEGNKSKSKSKSKKQSLTAEDMAIAEATGMTIG
ncbi:translation machinery-associated protein 16 [Dipsacomyces acuminosporus]|nr:translation machinery-associated protein 16 [Dipsacomyces acuminosporus]